MFQGLAHGLTFEGPPLSSLQGKTWNLIVTVIHCLCDIGQVTQPLWAYVSYSVK